ncbi:hypothetical protein N788_03650 [Arenimonas donghaensis DSM 18148 = HO3-R19]|uniref:DUF3987 domain-containing protein n=2 Tax=Arenimonas TaxID=490567 RepID=A0A087MIL2_9GAMM|nr:hypothetical protein N788_03650 [Arenimonas donghaensis DSM 18148 = HO3-R19]
MCANGQRFAIGEPEAPKQGKPLYRLPELVRAPKEAPVWIVEGEKCADALAALGLVATTSGACSSAAAADWSPLKGRKVILWPDHDDPGARYAEDVVSALRGRVAGCELVEVAALGLPKHGDCVNWLAANEGATARDLQALPRFEPEPETELEPSAPEPLRRPVPPAEPYPLAELGELLAPAAAAIRRVIQAPDAIIGGSLLAAASLATQAQADVHLDGRTYPLSLWLLSVAESGERKSAVDAEAMQAAREYEKELAKAYAEAADSHTRDLAEWEARRDGAKAEARKKSGQGLAEKLNIIGPKPEPPLLPRVTAADFTAEGLFKLLSVGRPTIGVFTDEAALVFGGHGMAKETVMRTAGTLCKLWDRGELDRVRSGDGASKLYGRRFALHLLAQPVIAERALSDDVLAGQGFLARCLLGWPEGTAGTRLYRSENLRDDVALQRLLDRLLYLHRLPLPLDPGEKQELSPRALSLSREAMELWCRLHDTVEGHCGPGGRFAQVKPWASKTPEQALRIAGVLTLLEDPSAQMIDASTLERAAEVSLWHLNEARRLVGTAEVSREVRDAEALLAWAHATQRRHLHSGEVLRLGPSRIREREAFSLAIGELERAGWAERIEGGMFLDGARRRHVWRIVPAEEGR